MEGNSKMKSLYYYILILPALSLFLVFLVAPLFFIVLLSFYTNSIAGYVPVFTFDNYISLFRSQAIGKILLDTLKLCGLTTLFTLLAGYPVAYALAYKISSPRKQALILLALVIPFLMDYSIRTISWYPILGTGGLVNIALMASHVTTKPINLLFSSNSLILIWLQTYVLLMITPIYLALSKVDRSLIDAARTLGASSAIAFFRVTLPLSLPGVVVGVIYVFVSTLSDYATPELFGGGIQTVGLEIAQRAAAFLWPGAAALAVIVIIMTLALAYVLTKFVDIQQLF
jgi:putative spermidine/putrescine transport system permease protein